MRTLLGILFIVIMLNVTPTLAATVNVVGGELQGATGVDVGGTLYTVEFLDGTCVSLYDNCDATTDFTFQTLADAQAPRPPWNHRFF